MLEFGLPGGSAAGVLRIQHGVYPRVQAALRSAFFRQQMLDLNARPRGVQENSCCIAETASVLGVKTSRTPKLCLLDALKVADVLHRI